VARVKICGLTSLEDALAAARAGADALGFVLAPSPRQVEPDRVRDIVRRLPALLPTVGVFVDAPADHVRQVRRFCGLDFVQLHGRESEETVAGLGGRVIKAVRPAEGGFQAGAFPGATLLFDSYSPAAAGGTGRCFDWRSAVETARQRPIILAGGLTPANVARAVGLVRPFAVDASSGLEIEPGRKDHARMASFVRRAKAAG